MCLSTKVMLGACVIIPACRRSNRCVQSAEELTIHQLVLISLLTVERLAHFFSHYTNAWKQIYHGFFLKKGSLVL